MRIPEANEAGRSLDPISTQTPSRPSLLSRLYEKRRQHQVMVERINNSIRVLEQNQALVEIVEIVLLSEQKADLPLY